MKNWYSSIYKAFIIASAVSFIISFFSQGDVSLGALLAGYSVLILGLMMLLLIVFQNILGTTTNQSTLQIMLSILMTTGPFLLMLGIIGFVMYLIINYKTNIINNQVSQSYYTFSNLTIILLLIQVYIVYTNISSNNFKTTGKISKVLSCFMYLLSVLTAICSLILFTVLKYYTTDGFALLHK